LSVGDQTAGAVPWTIPNPKISGS